MLGETGYALVGYLCYAILRLPTQEIRIMFKEPSEVMVPILTQLFY